MAARNLLEAIARGVVIFDGAMGTTLQRMQLAGELTVKDFDGRQGCNEVLSLTRPEVVAGVHRGYLEAGSDAIETNTFGASRPKLDEFDLGAKLYEVNFAAASVARWLHTASLLPGGQVLVAAGKDDRDAIKSLERYDPATNAWSASSP